MHSRSSRQRGGMMVLAAMLIIVLTGFAALALDIGRIFLVRNELQNVADAAALAGANCLTRESDPLSSAGCLDSYSTTGLNWARAEARAADQLSHNSADNTAISSTGTGRTIETGYWNLRTQSASGGSFNRLFSPLTADDRPAVRVLVRKDTGMNGGPVAMLTRIMFGTGADAPLSAQAVAVISAPGLVPARSNLLPVVINQCMFDTYWDSTANAPRIYNGPGSTPVDPYNLSTAGQPYRIRIGSSYHYGACDVAGQWTTFAEPGRNSASTVRDLIEQGSPVDLGIGSNTWIKPGTATTDYHAVDDTYTGQDVTVAVVSAPNNDLSTQGNVPIVAFAGFHIEAVVSGGKNGFYIQGHFIPGSVVEGGSGTGPFYGSYTPPRLGY